MGSIKNIDQVYFQVAHPSAGGNIPAGKVDNCDDALGKPGRFARNGETTATDKPDSHVEDLRDKQNGSNGMQCAGFKPNVPGNIPLLERRGFKDSK